MATLEQILEDARAVYMFAREADIQVPFVVPVEAYEEPSTGG